RVRLEFHAAIIGSHDVAEVDAGIDGVGIRRIDPAHHAVPAQHFGQGAIDFELPGSVVLGAVIDEVRILRCDTDRVNLANAAARIEIGAVRPDFAVVIGAKYAAVAAGEHNTSAITHHVNIGLRLLLAAQRQPPRGPDPPR